VVCQAVGAPGNDQDCVDAVSVFGKQITQPKAREFIRQFLGIFCNQPAQECCSVAVPLHFECTRDGRVGRFEAAPTWIPAGFLLFGDLQPVATGDLPALEVCEDLLPE